MVVFVMKFRKSFMLGGSAPLNPRYYGWLHIHTSHRGFSTQVSDAFGLNPPRPLVLVYWFCFRKKFFVNIIYFMVKIVWKVCIFTTSDFLPFYQTDRLWEKNSRLETWTYLLINDRHNCRSISKIYQAINSCKRASFLLSPWWGK